MNYTPTDFLFILLFAFGFEVLFWIHKKFFPIYYFGFGELVLRIKTKLRFIEVTIKIFIIILHSFVTILIFQDKFITCTSALLGSLFIILPAFINPSKIDPRLEDKKIIIRLIYSLFVVFSTLVASLSFHLFYLLLYTTQEVIKELVINWANIIAHAVGGCLILGLIFWLRKKLIIKQNNG